MEKINNVDLSKDKIILSDISKSGSQAIDAHFYTDSKALSSLIERYGLKEILENMVQQNNIYRGGGDDEIYRAGKELDILEDKLKATSAGALEQLNERSQHVEQLPDIIGKISYYGFRGEVVEVMEYTDTQEYLNAIKKEIDYNPDGFRHQTLTNNPEVKKSVDDIVYGAYGADNPHNLEWYSPQNVEARTIINDMVVKGNHILEVDIPITFNEFSNLFNIELKIDETLNQNIFSFERNGDVGHAYFAFKDGELDWIDEYDFRDAEQEGNREKVIPLSSILKDESINKRISDINIFSLKSGGMAIRCKIDSVQQSAEKMNREDVNSLSDKTDRYQLAAKYFAPFLSEEREINQSFKR